MSAESTPFRDRAPWPVINAQVEAPVEALTPEEQNAYYAFLRFEHTTFKEDSTSDEHGSNKSYLPELSYDFIEEVMGYTNERKVKASQEPSPLVDSTKLRSSIAHLHEAFDNSDPDQVHKAIAEAEVRRHYDHATHFKYQFAEINLAMQLYEGARKLGDERLEHAFKLLVASYGHRFESVRGIGSSATSRQVHRLIKHPGELNDY